MYKWIVGIGLLWILLLNSVEAKVIYDNPDGTNGYYRNKPTVTVYYEGNGVTKYRFKNADGYMLTGKLDANQTEETIPQEYFTDGINYLDIWNEDENGIIEESSVQQLKFMIDQTPPEYPLQFNEKEVLEILAADNGSGIAGIYFALNEKDFQYVAGDRAYIALPEGAAGRITAYAVDAAGNPGELCYFEKNVPKTNVVGSPITELEEKIEEIGKPEIFVEGNVKTQIINQENSVSFIVTGCSSISEVSALMYKKDLYEEVEYKLEEWKQVEQGYWLQAELKEDGIYEFKITAKEETLCYYLILDTSAPTFHSLEELDGKTLTEFQWNADMEQYVTDLTSLYAEVRIDGILCEKDVIYDEAGKHILDIYVKDLAGNESQESICFYIE